MVDDSQDPFFPLMAKRVNDQLFFFSFFYFFCVCGSLTYIQVMISSMIVKKSDKEKQQQLAS